MEPLEFCQKLPKIELHAHLNGSLSEDTLKKLGCLNENIAEYQQLTKLLQTTDKTLEQCFELFKVAQNATNLPKKVYLATQSVINDFFSDNVIYLEIRTTPRSEPSMTKMEYIEAVIKAIEDNKNDIIVKLILSIDRRHDSQTSLESLELFKIVRNKYPEIVKGVDLSGNPHVGTFELSLFNEFRQNGFKTSLHCAEIQNDKEVEKILNFCPDRLGHATWLHPEHGGTTSNWELYCLKKIPVECCLTSNIVCGTSTSYKSHHLGKWIEAKMPFTIGTDDKGVFCTTLSDEYLHAKKAFDLSNEQLWKISYNSIDYTFCSPEEKTELRSMLNEWQLNHLI